METINSISINSHEVKEDFSHLEKKVKEQSLHLQQVEKELTEAAFRAGMAEVATEILHNAGNILNSVILNASQTQSKIASEYRGRIDKLIDVFSNEVDFLSILEDSVKRKLLKEYVLTILKAIKVDNEELERDCVEIYQGLNLLNESIRSQQNFAGGKIFQVNTDIKHLIGEALKLFSNVTQQENIFIKLEHKLERTFNIRRGQVSQVLVNVLKNAMDSVGRNQEDEREIFINTFMEGDFVVVRVKDNGSGILAENIAKIFEFGFTTKKDGYGFGLHSSANMMKEMGGELRVKSDGFGLGAQFDICIPSSQEKEKES